LWLTERRGLGKEPGVKKTVSLLLSRQTPCGRGFTRCRRRDIAVRDVSVVVHDVLVVLVVITVAVPPDPFQEVAASQQVLKFGVITVVVVIVAGEVAAFRNVGAARVDDLLHKTCRGYTLGSQTNPVNDGILTKSALIYTVWSFPSKGIITCFDFASVE
jgi:hypothetical protein